MRINFDNIAKGVLTKYYFIPLIWSDIPNFTTLFATAFWNFLHNSSILGAVIQIWKNPDFQYSKLSFVRLSAFGSVNPNISNPTWLPELNQTIRIFFKFGPWISLRTIPNGESSITISIGQFITLNPNTSWYHFTALSRLVTLTAIYLSSSGIQSLVVYTLVLYFVCIWFLIVILLMHMFAGISFRC